MLEATISLHRAVCSKFLPTAVKFYYGFNLRDLSCLVQVTVESLSPPGLLSPGTCASRFVYILRNVSGLFMYKPTEKIVRFVLLPFPLPWISSAEDKPDTRPRLGVLQWICVFDGNNDEVPSSEK